MRAIKPISLILCTLIITACSTHHPLDERTNEQNYKQVTLLDGDTVGEPLRYWSTQETDFLYDPQNNSTPLVSEEERLSILALSGGGANGAYGAGVIMGLHDQQKLPQYSVITGISVGGLIAPFVFVGDERLAHLPEMIQEINDKRLLGKKNFANALFKDAFSKGDSMQRFISETYSVEMIDKIAQQHRAGKRLFIGTTHFDSGELMIWNLGAIANSELANRIDLVHQVLMATAAIPGVFPPQFIDVEDNSQQLEELHVDGGLAAQVFFNPTQFDYPEISQVLGLTEQPRLDVIRNGVLSQPYQPVKDKGVPLLMKSLSNLTTLQVRGDIYRMKYFCEKAGIDMRLTYLDKDFSASRTSKDFFDQSYMQAIYHYGYERATNGSLWNEQEQ